jgi:AcrR family transcriptional regulator
MERQVLDSEKPKTGTTGRRALQAAQTRDDIVRAARERFASQGFAATTLKQIAGDAGVSVQTVYDSVGTKADLVRRLNDRIDTDAGVAEVASRLGTATDPDELVQIPARITRQIIEHCGDIVRAALAAALVDDDLARLAEEGGRRHRAGASVVAQRLAGLDALRPGLSVEEAALTIAALTDTRLGLLVIDDFGLDFDQLESWMARAVSESVLVR